MQFCILWWYIMCHVFVYLLLCLGCDGILCVIYGWILCLMCIYYVGYTYLTIFHTNMGKWNFNFRICHWHLMFTILSYIVVHNLNLNLILFLNLKYLILILCICIYVYIMYLMYIKLSSTHLKHADMCTHYSDLHDTWYYDTCYWLCIMIHGTDYVPWYMTPTWYT